MRHYRYLGLLANIVCVQAGTLDELHQKIQQRNKRNGARALRENIIDTARVTGISGGDW